MSESYDVIVKPLHTWRDDKGLKHPGPFTIFLGGKIIANNLCGTDAGKWAKKLRKAVKYGIEQSSLARLDSIHKEISSDDNNSGAT